MVWYIGECMVSIIDINKVIKEYTHGCQNCNTSQILIIGGYLTVRVCLYIWVIIWGNIILYHIDTREMLPRHEGSCTVYRSNWYQKQNYRQMSIPYWYQQIWNLHCKYLDGVNKYEILIIDTWMVSKNVNHHHRYLNGIKKWQYQINSTFNHSYTQGEVFFMFA